MGQRRAGPSRAPARGEPEIAFYRGTGRPAGGPGAHRGRGFRAPGPPFPTLPGSRCGPAAPHPPGGACALQSGEKSALSGTKRPSWSSPNVRRPCVLASRVCSPARGRPSPHTDRQVLSPGSAGRPAAQHGPRAERRRGGAGLRRLLTWPRRKLRAPRRPATPTAPGHCPPATPGRPDVDGPGGAAGTRGEAPHGSWRGTCPVHKDSGTLPTWHLQEGTATPGTSLSTHDTRCAPAPLPGAKGRRVSP